MGAATHQPAAPFVIGLTGPIGCGKSTVASILAGLGGTVIDADALARAVTAPGQPALAEIRARFGDAVYHADGSLDRAALGRVVFSDAAALADLEWIVHPGVRRLIVEALERATAVADPFVAIEAIKLVEGGLAEQCDEVWIVECAPEAQRARLLGRGMTPADADARMAAQGPHLAHRLAEALGQGRERHLSTDGSLEETRERVEDALADALGPLMLHPWR